jgi:hypothetical protein
MDEQAPCPFEKLGLAGQGRLSLPLVLDHDKALITSYWTAAIQAGWDMLLHRRSHYPAAADLEELEAPSSPTTFVNLRTGRETPSP